MSNFKWNNRLATYLILVLSLLVYSTAIAKIERNVEKILDVKPGGLLTLDTDLGSIDIATHDKNTVDVKVNLIADTRSESKAEDIINNFRLEFDQTGDNVEVFGELLKRKSFNFWGSNRNRLKVEFLILVPSNYNLDIRTSGGSIYVQDLTGEIDASTSGGSLTFEHIDGPVFGKTSGGSITLKSCKGLCDVKTSGGSIKIGEVDGEVIAKTSGGSIKVNEVHGTIDASTSGGSVTAKISEQPKSDCRLTTSGGSVNVYLADNIAVDLDAKTSAGSVYTDFDVTVRGKLKKTSVRGKINGGGPELYLRTSGGSIYINEM